MESDQSVSRSRQTPKSDFRTSGQNVASALPGFNTHELKHFVNTYAYSYMGPNMKSILTSYLASSVDHGRSDELGCWGELEERARLKKTNFFLPSFSKRPCLSEFPDIYASSLTCSARKREPPPPPPLRQGPVRDSEEVDFVKLGKLSKVVVENTKTAKI